MGIIFSIIGTGKHKALCQDSRQNFWHNLESFLSNVNFSKNLGADLLRMHGVESISQVSPLRLYYNQNFIFTQVSHCTLDYMHVKAGLNDF